MLSLRASAHAGVAIPRLVGKCIDNCPTGMGNTAFFGFYVNSWGRDKTQIIASRVGAESPARFLCTAEEDSVSEITEVTYPEADPLQDFGLVVAALNKAI